MDDYPVAPGFEKKDTTCLSLLCSISGAPVNGKGDVEASLRLITEASTM